MKRKQKFVCLFKLLTVHKTVTLCRVGFLLLLLSFGEKADAQGLLSDCPNFPPLVQVFCGNYFNAFDCILESWVCDGTLDCDSGLDESQSTCDGVDPCMDQKCQNGAACEAFVAKDRESVAYYICHCPPQYTGQYCDSLVNETTTEAFQTTDTTPPVRTSVGINPTSAATTTTPLQQSTGVTTDAPVTATTTAAAPTPDPGLCRPNPCLNGVCSPLRNGFHCSCRPGFTGTHCDLGINVCESLPCINGGTCQRTGRTSYTCSCASGYAGRQCELEVDECTSSPCLNAGSCQDHLNGFTCSCSLGYTGPRCESRIDHCASALCVLSAGGHCVNGLLTYSCECPSSRAGQYCERPQRCTDDPCFNYGVCFPATAPGEQLRCVCLPGFTGQRCEINIDDCSPGICGPHGRCIDGIQDYICSCDSGYEGRHCETEVDPCDPNPCYNDGYCCRHGRSWCGGLLPRGYFECYCANSFTGALCDERTDPCSPDPCLNRGLCNKIGTSYLCTCPLTYTGQNCESAIPCASQPCLNQATCLDIAGDFQCQCDPDHYGRYCQLLQPCLSRPCQNGATCVNNGASYVCDCPAKYTGMNCETVLSCSSQPCLNGAECIDTEDGGDYTCVCQEQYTGSLCDVPLPCAEDPCGEGGTCSAVDGAFSCDCYYNHTGDTCDVFLPCASQPCLNDGECVERGETFVCDCTFSYTGVLCETFLPCGVQPCFNNGICRNVGDDFTCECPPVFTGAICDVSLACSSRPCQNNGNCVPTSSGYRCECTPAYSGLDCEMFLPCTTVPCLNGGQCTNLVDGSYKCLCAPEYTGDNCQLSTLCIPNPCLGGGECSVDGSTVNCACVPPYTGEMCDSFDACLATPCKNGGTCTTLDDGIDTYQCACTAAYSGKNCDQYLHCTSRPCLNNGACENILDGYACNCTKVFGGRNCETPIPCGSNPCQNEAECENRGSNYQCTCRDHYTGTHCETTLACASGPCVTGQCLNIGAAQYSCQCEEWFTGRHCETPLACGEDTCVHGQCVQLECVCDPGYAGLLCERAAQPCDSSPCVNGGTCSDVDTSDFACACPQQYTGTHCETRLLPCDSAPCLFGGTCSNVGDSYVCSCRESYTGSRCEYQQGICDSEPCQNGARCVEDGTSFTCICRPPYTGELCTALITSCLPDPCENGGSCSSDSLGIFCECTTQYEGLLCQWMKGVCDPNPCRNSGECWQIEGAPVCDCSKGFRGEMCQEAVTGCDPNPCNEGDCAQDSRRGEFQCSCPPEWLGTQCQITNPCHSQPCGQGSTCVARDTDYVCYCPIGYTGQSCDSPLAACHSEPCLNGGTCLDGGSTLTFSCSCVAGYTGAICRTNVNDCEGNDLCRNGAQCVDLVNGFRCDCDTGYSGQYCTIRDNCLTSPCVNAAQCLNTPSPAYDTDYTCVCTGNFVGPNCELYNFCISQPCKNDGTCSNYALGYRCSCPALYTGTQCEEKTIGCEGVTCSDRGQCEPQGQFGYQCQCTGGYTGVNCELSPCDSSPCEHGGTCFHDDTGHYCQCLEQWAGLSCEIDTSVLAPSFSSQSYLQLPPLEGVSGTTAIDVLLYPRGPGGLILYASQGASGGAAQGDFMALSLRDARLLFQINLGSGVLSLTGPPVTLNQWQRVQVSRSGREVTLQVGSQSVEGSTPGSNNGLTVETPLWVGGVPETVELHDEVTVLDGFDGCIHEIQVGSERAALLPWTLTQQSQRVTQCDLDPCGLTPCANGGQCRLNVDDDDEEDNDDNDDDESIQCLCRQGFTGQQCQTVTGFIDFPQLSALGYLAYSNVMSVSSQLSLTVRVKPASSSGLLLYNMHKNDHFALYLSDGYLFLTFNLGSGATTLRSNDPLTLNSWHNVRVSRSQRQGRLEVNDQQAVSGEAAGSSQQQEVGKWTYVGGVPSTVAVAAAVSVETGFEGCIETLSVEGIDLDVTAPDEGYGVTDCLVPACDNNQCAGGATCVPHPGTDLGYQCLCPAGSAGDLCQQTVCEAVQETARCQNGGTCIVSEQGLAQCLCTLSYTGPTCTEDLRFTVAALSGNSYLAYDPDTFMGSNYFGAQMVFRTNHSDALLIWLGEVTADYISVGLHGGFLEFRAELGSGMGVITSTLNRLDTDEWFHVIVQQSGTSLSLQITDSAGQASTYSGLVPGNDQNLDVATDGALYAGGVPEVSGTTGGAYTLSLKGCIIQLMGGTRTDQWSTLRLQGDATDGVGISTCQV